MKNFLEKNGLWAISRKKKKKQDRKATGVDRKARQETEKWNQMIALSFQTGERNNKHDRPPFGGRHRTSPPK